MKVPRYWNDRFEIIDGKIYRIVRAYWYEHELDVYQESDDGEYYKRNLYQSCMRGWCVAFPGLKFYERGDPAIAQLEGWCQLSKAGNFGGGELTEEDKDIICSVYPSFRYTLNKYKIEMRWACMEALIMWKQHPELEYVLAAGYATVGMSKYFWRLSEVKRKQMCLFMRRHPECKEFTTQEILSCLKSKDVDTCAEYFLNVDKYERQGCLDYRITYDDFVYLKKIKDVKKDCFDTVMKRKVSVFKDVLRMLSQSEHDMNDPYWRHNKDIFAIHAKLLEEREKARAARILAENQAAMKKLKSLVKKFAGLPQKCKGYSIFITPDFAEWQRQAKALHQCIVASGYYQGMAEGKYTIVFIQKNGVPMATAQVMPNGTIHQFYADEVDRDNCLPSPEIKAAFDKWMKKVPVEVFSYKKAAKKKAA